MMYFYHYKNFGVDLEYKEGLLLKALLLLFFVRIFLLNVILIFLYFIQILHFLECLFLVVD